MQVNGATQSLLTVQVFRQAVALQAYGSHIDVVAVWQVPVPLQDRAGRQRRARAARRPAGRPRGVAPAAARAVAEAVVPAAVHALVGALAQRVLPGRDVGAGAERAGDGARLAGPGARARAADALLAQVGHALAGGGAGVPVGFLVHTPVTQTLGAAQSASAVHDVLHTLVAQVYVPHDDVSPRQVPVPLHVRAGVNVVPLQLAATHTVPPAYSRQAPPPSQKPSAPQVAGRCRRTGRADRRPPAPACTCPPCPVSPHERQLPGAGRGSRSLLAEAARALARRRARRAVRALAAASAGADVGRHAVRVGRQVTQAGAGGAAVVGAAGGGRPVPQTPVPSQVRAGVNASRCRSTPRRCAAGVAAARAAAVAGAVGAAARRRPVGALAQGVGAGGDRRAGPDRPGQRARPAGAGAGGRAADALLAQVGVALGGAAQRRRALLPQLPARQVFGPVQSADVVHVVRQPPRRRTRRDRRSTATSSGRRRCRCRSAGREGRAACSWRAQVGAGATGGSRRAVAHPSVPQPAAPVSVHWSSGSWRRGRGCRCRRCPRARRSGRCRCSWSCSRRLAGRGPRRTRRRRARGAQRLLGALAGVADVGRGAVGVGGAGGQAGAAGAAVVGAARHRRRRRAGAGAVAGALRR